MNEKKRKNEWKKQIKNVSLKHKLQNILQRNQPKNIYTTTHTYIYIHIYKDIYIKVKNVKKWKQEENEQNPEQVLVKVYLEQNCHIKNIIHTYIYYYIYIESQTKWADI